MSSSVDVHDAQEYGLNLEEDVATAHVSHAAGVTVCTELTSRFVAWLQALLGCGISMDSAVVSCQ
jgi:hypothetical protein